ncbi:NTP hydrolase p-loop and helicase domains-containing [Desulfonema limicola]|uniref:NTP hydrolase p-loop and helicase domains-containing n=1 Tax=Desulfonema limicola TaxID=45656 RepID=A0A975GEX3_9BACT|nr:DEAD/DEAH box helicase [Desulfonema limicola]QTA78672.1 NTP hydrolase p-loop and helicase domains-containing [Desulfonema limicola]
MEKEINLLHFSNELIETYRRYLFSATPISEDEPELKEEFWKRIEEFHFFNGPYIQYQPSYTRSIPFAELFTRSDNLSLDTKLKSCFKSEDLDRPEFRLYTHQADALVKSKQGENILIATGTGSGKTECFLLPILDDAIKNPGPGIRSIIIYPMNALANDQLDRLTHMLRQFANDEVTFGRYTGETPWNEEDAQKKYPDYESISCERFTREEIRENPPHILLTNFAMLEYLLIRPKDIEIFRHQKLRYIVLDEAHTYRGAQGIEIALLMRRLQEAFKERELRYFLTSATFTSGISEDVKTELSEFASKLTGSLFKSENILFGNTNNPFSDTVDTKSFDTEELLKAIPDEKTLQEWIADVSEPEKLHKRLIESGLITLDFSENAKNANRLLYDILKNNKLIKQVYHQISEKPSNVNEIAEAIWKQQHDKYRRIIQWLLIMGSRAKPSPESAPLLGTKIHIFFRGLNGASVCLSPDCSAKNSHQDSRWSNFSLESLRTCPVCESKVFPLAVCWHCGLPVLSLYINDNRWYALAPPVQSDTKKRNLTWWDGTEIDDSGQDTENDDEAKNRYAYVCTCGIYSEIEKKMCDCGKNTLKLRIIECHEQEINKCPRCGGESGAFDGVTRTFITADDAPTAVLTDIAMRNIPKSENAKDKPAWGRRLLAFSDSRQRAAFFAPYLKRTACESAYQQPLLEAILQCVQNNNVASFDEVADKFVQLSKNSPYVVTWDNIGEENETYRISPSRKIGHAIRRQLKSNCLISLYRHFCNSMRQRNKLMGLALCSVFVEILEDEKENLRKKLSELCQQNDDYLSAIQLLLNIFMARKAVRFIDSVQSHHISRVISDATFHRSQSQSSISRWNPYHAQTKFAKRMAINRSRQLKLLCKWTGMDADADSDRLSEILDIIWDALFDENDPSDSVLIDAGYGKRKLNGERILLEIPKSWLRCQNCGHIVPQAMSFKNLCPSPDCPGKLEIISPSALETSFQNNHQRQRYKTEPLPLEVKEHTAQLQLRSSRQYQEDFKKGMVNVLSCSTTFEMGVDVGALKVTMLRNIPPSPANYIQRAGRVGRRNDGVSYVVTFARKLPHDQYHFGNPLEIISGKVDIPYLNLENDILAQRHVNSFLLGQYLKDDSNQDIGDKVLIKDFFLSPDSGNSSASKFPVWMEKNKDKIINALSRIIPGESRLAPETAYNNSLTALYAENDKSVFQRHIQLTIEDYEQQIEELKGEAEKAGDNNKYKSFIYNCIGNIENYKKRFTEQRLIDFLSKVSWLPGYAFPQDVVELRVLQPQWQDKMSLTRDRDIGISEYAPGAEIIADGKIFKSKGVVGRRGSLEGTQFEPKKYVSCGECRILKQFPIISKSIPKKCDCGRNYPRQRIYIIPEGFSTSVKDPVLDPKFRRILPPPNTEVFLVEGAGHDEFTVHPDINTVKYALKREGRLFRANMGYKRKQFRICMKCGSLIESGNGKAHDTPWGNRCSAGSLQIKPVDLANEFRTDVLELRFTNSPAVSERIFWISFLSAFLNGVTRKLNIASNDLDGLYARIPETESDAELIIYDRIPGGAGYLKRIIENLKVCLEATLDVVKNCKDPACNDLESSCYACLRSYRNQFNWDDLRRKPVIDWLSSIIS